MQIPFLLCETVRQKPQLFCRYSSPALRFLQRSGRGTFRRGSGSSLAQEVPKNRTKSHSGTGKLFRSFCASSASFPRRFQRKNDTYEFLSGVAVTPRTQFLSLHENADLELFQTVIHFAHYAVRVYGWPIYLMTSSLGVCHICSKLTCGCCFPCQKPPLAEVVEDNCCKCNYAVLQKLSDIGDIEIIYATYHVDVGETPFFVALDYDRKKVVVGIRGTLSMQVLFNFPVTTKIFR